MTLQLISFLVIIAVLVIDLVVSGRKKANDDAQIRIQGNEGLKKFNLFEYLFRRKKNAIIFILFVFLSKPILHVSFFTETKEEVNYNKKIIENPLTKDYYMFNSKGDLIHQKDYIYSTNRESVNEALKGEEFRILSKIFEIAGNLMSRGDISDLRFATIKGEMYIKEEIGEESFNIFYYPLETIPLSFNEHLEVMFKSKLWIFLVSIGVLTVIVFLFNDKIKAR